MRVKCFYGGSYPNGFSPMSMRLHYYMKALAAEGAEVEVVVPSAQQQAPGTCEGIPYRYEKAPAPTRFNTGTVARAYAALCGRLARECDALIVIVQSRRALKRCADAVHRAGGRVVFELNENPGSIRASRLDTPLSLRIERWNYLHRLLPRADGVIVISHPLEELVCRYKRPNTQSVRIPILSGSDRVAERPAPAPSDGIPYLLHAGALSEQKDGIMAMLQGYAVARERLGGKLRFVFTYKVGFPGLLARIDRFIAENGLGDDVRFTGIVDRQTLEELRRNCALCIVNKPSNAQNDYNFPTKLTELLPEGVPLIVSRTGEPARYFRDGENAHVVEANDAGQIADRIVRILGNPEETARITRGGQLLNREAFYYQNHAPALADFFRRVAQTSRK